MNCNTTHYRANSSSVPGDPTWMRRTGLEWVYRLMQEPRRLFRRYAHDLAAFGWGMSVQALALRRRPKTSVETTALQFLEKDGAVHLELPPVLDLQAARHLAGMQFASGQCWLLDGARVVSVDSSGLAWLSSFSKRTCARCVVLVNSSRHLQRALRRMQLASLFHTAPDLQAGLDLARSQTASEPVWVSRSTSSASITLRFHGEITAVNAPRVWAQAQAHLYGIHPGQVWKFDLQDVPFIDTTGLQLISRAADAVRRAGATPTFSGMCREVLNVIQHARLQGILQQDKRSPATSPSLSPASAG